MDKHKRMKRYAVLLVTLIVANRAALRLTPTLAKPATLTRLPTCTPTATRTMNGASDTEAVINTIAFQQEQGQIYYVATDGDDGDPGTEAQPFRTITRGIGVLGPGDTLYVKSGTYIESLGDFPSGTSWDNPVLIKAYPGDVVTVKPNSGALVVEFINGMHHIILDGFILDGENVTRNVIKMEHSGTPHHTRVINCEIKNSPRTCVLIAHGCDYHEFINCDVHHAPTGYGFYIIGSYNLVEGCDIHDNSQGWGVHVYSGHAGYLPNHNIIRSNRVYDNRRHDSNRGTGIGIYTGSGNIVYNNLVWGANWGGITVDYGSSDTEIYNNTVYSNRQHGIYIGSEARNTTVRNNISYLNSGSQMYDRGDETAISHNLTDTDPHFVAPVVHDFHLLENSPAIDSGVALSQVPDDFDGVSRPRGAGYDIGAYESLFPIKVTDLHVVNAIGDTPTLTVTLRWTAPALAITYSMRSSNTLLTMANWDDSPVITVPFTASESGSSEWLTTPVDYAGGTLYLALKSQDSAGTWSGLSNNASWPHMGVYLPLIMKDEDELP